MYPRTTLARVGAAQPAQGPHILAPMSYFKGFNVQLALQRKLR